jgi:hypothetical protein
MTGRCNAPFCFLHSSLLIAFLDVIDMPSASQFKNAYGVLKGGSLGKRFKILSSQVDHVPIKERQQYEYPTTLILTSQDPNADVTSRNAQREVKKAWKKEVEGQGNSKIVYSAYGSPYECSFSEPSLRVLESGGGVGNDRLELDATGTAVRRRDIPTLPQQKQAERGEGERRAERGGGVE